MVIPYARGAAVRYARRWALSRNPRWYDFENLGGDCTNFASQCLFAGSGIMNFQGERGWYYFSLEYRSPSWTGVEFLYDFLVSNKARGPFATESGMEDMRLGDVIQLGQEDGFYHSLLVTGIRDGQLYVAAHTFNAYMRPLSSYTFEKIRFLHIEGVYE